MRPMHAVCFALAGLAALILKAHHTDRRRWIAPLRYIGRACGLAVVSIGLLLCYEAATRQSLGVDAALFPRALEALWQTSGPLPLMTNVALLLLGLAICLPLFRRRPPWAAVQWLALGVVLIGGLTLEGYLLGVGWTGALFSSSVSFCTALLLVLLGVGLLFERPEHGFMEILARRDRGGEVARRYLPIVILLPIFLGWLRWQGEVAGFYGTAFGLAIFVIANCVALSSVVWSGAVRLSRLEHERKQAEEQREINETRLAGIIDSAMDAIITVNDAQVVTLFNPAAEKMFDCKASEAMNQSLDRFIPPRFRGSHGAHIQKFGETGVTKRKMGGLGSIYGLRPNGEEFPIEASISQVTIRGQKLYTVILRDIGERMQLEERLRQSQKMEAIGQLAGGVAHDFNNLLTVIVGYCEVVLADLPAGAAQRALIEEILAAGLRAATLTGQLLAFSRKQVVTPQVLDVNEAVRQIEKMLRRLIGEDISLNAVLEPNLSHVKIDPGQLEQIIINLAVNARDAMPVGGHLTIETHGLYMDAEFCRLHPGSLPGWYVLLSISDSGCGMPPEVRTHVFEPFFTTKGQGKGTGLGLATVFGIVTQCGGMVDVYSEVNLGTCFKIYLPAVMDGATAKAGPEPQPVMRPRHETILLVEDETAVRKIAKLTLNAQGYTVLEAESGRRGLEVAQQHVGPLDLVITDVVMPELGGRQMVEALLQSRPELKVLFMSGYIDDAVVRHGIIDGRQAFLRKPFSQADLVRKVDEVLEQAQSATNKA
jgi:PAS domain S-box-containing protein